MRGQEARADGGHLHIHVPIRLRKRGGRKEIVAPEGAEREEKQRAHRPLVIALARAFYWQELLDSGHYRDIRELAFAIDIDRSYVARILQLALLPPWLVEAILEGKEPDGTTVRGLVEGVKRGVWAGP